MTKEAPKLNKNEVSLCLIAAKIFYTRRITAECDVAFGRKGTSNNSNESLNGISTASLQMDQVWENEAGPIRDELLAEWQIKRAQNIPFNPDKALSPNIQTKIQDFAIRKFGENLGTIQEIAAIKTSQTQEKAQKNFKLNPAKKPKIKKKASIAEIAAADFELEDDESELAL